jgi:hypothetical protein
LTAGTENDLAGRFNAAGSPPGNGAARGIICPGGQFQPAANKDGPGKNLSIVMAKQKARVQGAQIPRNEAYIRYAAVTKNAAQVSADSDAAVGEFLRHIKKKMDM